MASLQSHGSVASTNVPFSKAPYKDTEYKSSSARREPQFSETVPMSEKDVLLITHRANKLNKRPDLGNVDEQPLTQEQQDKGISWLRKRTFAKKGTIKDSSELREREADVIDPTKPKPTIVLKDFYPDYNPYTKRDTFYPVYEVTGNGGSFEYYYAGGKVNIIG